MADYISTTGAAGVSEALKSEYFRRQFLTTLEKNLVFKQWGLMGEIPKNEGKTVKWARVENITTASTSNMEGQDPDATAWSANQLSAQLIEHKQWLRVSDFYRDSSLAGTMDQIVQRLGYKAAEDIDTDIRDTVFTGGGSAQIGGTAIAIVSLGSDSSFQADVNEFREAVATLRSNDVPAAEGAYYVGLIHPLVEFDLQGDDDWKEIVKYGAAEQERLTQAITSDTYGTRFFTTTQVKVATDGASAAASKDVFDSYIFGAEYYGLSELGDMELIVKSPFPGSATNSYDSLAWKYKFISKELSSTRMVKVQTIASKDAS